VLGYFGTAFSQQPGKVRVRVRVKG